MGDPRNHDVATEATQRPALPACEPSRSDLEVTTPGPHRAPPAGAIAVAQIGRFELLDTVASGGMGIVFRAHDPQLDRDVALKLVKPGLGDDRLAREGLLAEARVLARLRHPNVVPVHDVAVIDDQVVMVMELVEGQTLAEWQASAPRSWREIVEVYAAAGRGLAAAHALGLVHRDFKPSNVIVGDDGRVRVIDFGLACVAAAPVAPRLAAGSSRHARRSSSRSRGIVGTPVYMAPEQLAGDEGTPASDQFSFCVALYEALFEVRPFSGASVPALLHAVHEQRLVPSPRGSVPGWLRALVLRGLAADPAARHASVAALVAALERPRRPARVPLLAALVLGTAVIASAVTAGLIRPERAPAPVDPVGADHGADVATTASSAPDLRHPARLDHLTRW